MENPKIKLSFSSTKISSTDVPLSVLLKRGVSSTDNQKISSTDTKVNRGTKMNAYNRDHYDRLQLNIPKGGKEELDRACTELGMRSKVQLLEKGVKALRILKKQAEKQGKTLEMYMEELQ